MELLAHLRAGQVEEGGEPLDADTVSFNATINALGRGGEWKKAVALLREMTKAGLGVKVCYVDRCFPPFVQCFFRTVFADALGCRLRAMFRDSDLCHDALCPPRTCERCELRSYEMGY